MDFQVRPTPLEGLFELHCKFARDERGTFLKNFRHSQFRELGLETSFPEEFVTTSQKGVLRGFHFQTPPHDHVKVVSCLAGSIRDVVVDLRRSSPTFGHHEVFELSPDQGRSIYIPKGFAHAFLALEDQTVVHYQVSTEHYPLHDAGIKWDSVGVEWLVKDPMISARDLKFPAFREFDSPFP